MVNKPPRPCLDCGTPTQGTRCKGCTQPKERAKQQTRGRTPHARRLRQAINKAGGAHCNHCNKWRGASDIRVDHTTPLHQGGQDCPTNVRPLCLDCHQTKTDNEARERYNTHR